VVVALVALMSLAAGVWPEGGDVTRPQQAASRPAPRVLVQSPQRRTIHRVIRLAADVVALHQVVVEPMITGHVKALNVDVGSRVAKDAVLIELDAPEIAAQVDAAKAAALRAANVLLEVESAAALARVNVTEAEGNVEVAKSAVKRAQEEVVRSETGHRYRVLVRDRLVNVIKASPSLVSQETVDEAEGAVDVARDEVRVRKAGVAEAGAAAASAGLKVDVAKARVKAAEAQVKSAIASLEVAKAELQRAQAVLAYATIRAPFAGIVTGRWIDPGDLVHAHGSEKLLELVDASRVRVRFHVAEPDALAATPGRAVSLRVDELGDRTFRSTVARTADALDQRTRTMLVEGEVENPDGALRHGMYGRVALDLEEHRNALVIPARAITTAKGKSSVLVVAGGKVEKRAIRIGADDGLVVQVLDGLAEADAVITSGGALVAPGDAAEAVRENAP
jgi:RND family efflux transporter MFP subunit